MTSERFSLLSRAVVLPHWSTLLEMPKPELGRIYVAQKNLSLTAGLPRAEKMGMGNAPNTRRISRTFRKQKI